MMPTLYFLRSSEQKITTDILPFAYRLDEVNKTLEDLDELTIYNEFYGLSRKDLGLYALVDNKIAGAAWIRLLKSSDNANAFVDERTPVLTISVLPEFRSQGIGSAMLEQLLLEAGSLFEQISISVLSADDRVRFFEKLGFEKVERSNKKSPVDGSDVITMVKSVSSEAVFRPSDGYDPKRWMD